MDSAGISVDLSSRDELGQEYQVNFDSNVDADLDELDFGLDTEFDQTEHPTAEVAAENVPIPNSEPKVGHEDQDAHEDEEVKVGQEVQRAHEDEEVHEDGGAQTEAAGDDQPQHVEDSHDAAGNIDGEVDYQDEIGYEDDDGLVAGDFNADVESTEPTGADAGSSRASAEPQPERAQSDDESCSETLAHEKGPAPTQDIDLGEHIEGLNRQGEYPEHDYDEDADSPMADHDVTADGLDDETMHEYSTTEHQEEIHPGLSDLDKEFEDLAHSLYAIFDIEVLYNEESYSLIGGPDDDPDHYFLSDPKELDRPLSQFLSALRAVISNEVSPTDELVVHFEPLELEFGERSNEKFLSRSFRELLECHTALGTKDASFAPDPVLRLVVRRDSEEHFLALLAEAGDVEDDQSHSPEHLEASESHNEEPDVKSPDEPEENASFEVEDSGEYHANGDDTADSAAHDHAAPELAEGKNELLPETTSDHYDLEGEEGHNVPAEARSPQTQGLAKENAPDEDNVEDDSAKDHPDEYPEGLVDQGEDWAEEAAEDAGTASEHPEMAVEMSEEQSHGETPHQDEDGPGEVVELSTTDTGSAPPHGELEQGTASNGKYPLSVNPTSHVFGYHKQTGTPVIVTLLHLAEREDDLIDYTDDEEPPFSALMSQARQRSPQTPQKPAKLALGLAPAAEEDELWMIDYSDDEDGPTTGSGTITDRRGSTEARCSDGLFHFRDTNTTHLLNTNANIFQDDDLILTFDEEPELSTVQEEADEYEEYAFTFDTTGDTTNEAEGVAEPLVSDDIGGSTSKNSQNGSEVAAAVETASAHSSTTFGGDEINYDEQTAADASVSHAGGGAQQPAAAAGVDNDEIDWNDEDEDEDEDEEQPSGAEGVGENGGPQEVTLTPSSIAGKRNRTDEAESLAEETGMPAFPPAKRTRLC